MKGKGTPLARELSQLLLEEGMVTPEGLQRALARQRGAGGTLDTALLELELVAEGPLVAALARASDLPAAPLSAYERVDARARRVFPSKVAERHGLAPFGLDGRELSLVAICPVDLSLLDEVSFMLSLHLTPHVGPEWRVRSLIQRLYGGPLPPRLARLAEQSASRGTSPGVVAAEPGSTETEPVGPMASSDEAPAVAAPGIYLGSAMPAVTAGPVAPGGTGPTRPPPGFAGFSRELGEPLEPLSAALAEALEIFDVEALEPAPDAAPGADLQAGGAETAAPGAPTPAEEAALTDRSVPPRWSPEQARAELARARSRDEVVVTALRYARDLFEFAALFAVTRDAVAGHDALGADGDARDLARTVAVYSSDPGIFRTAIETMAPYLGRVDRTSPANQAVLDALGRGTPRTVLVTPILLRNRPVCLLYADNGAAAVSARRLGDLLLFCSTVGAAFERIIKTRKGDGPLPGEARPTEPPPSYFRQPEPAWRGPVGETGQVTAAEADYLASGGQLELDELRAPSRPEPSGPAARPAPGPMPEPAPEPPPEPALEPTLAAVPEQEIVPTLEAVPEPVPSPEPLPEPVAAPESEPEFLPVPEPAAVPEPESEAAWPPTELAPESPPPEGDPPPGPQAPVESTWAIDAEPSEPPPGFVALAAPLLGLEEAPEPLPEAPLPGLDDPAPLAAERPPPLEVTTELALPEPEPQPEPVPSLEPPPPEPPPPLEPIAGPTAPDEPEPQGAGDPVAALVDAYLESGLVTPGSAPGPGFEAIVAIGRPAVPRLLGALHDAAPSRRRAAATLLGAIGEPASLAALADRCLDPAPEVAEAAREALAAHRGTPAIRPFPERLRRALASGLPARAAPAARALSALRDVESIPNLIQALDGTDPSTAAAAAEALSAITLQRHGTATRQWLLWWKENRGRGRAEWLFGGLTADDREVRAAAADELARIAPPPVAYSPDQTAPVREQAARAWAGWFTRSGYRL